MSATISGLDQIIANAQRQLTALRNKQCEKVPVLLPKK